MTDVLVYSRFSTDGQDRTSTVGQQANCDALAAREGLRIVKRFADEGRPGYDDQRPEYLKLLAELKRGTASGLIVDETSRVSRNQAELHRLVAELKFRDQFLLTADGVDTRNENAELLLAVRGAIDAMEGRRIGYRVFRALRERHREGHHSGGRTYGYRQVVDGDYKRRVIEKAEAVIVNEIFDRFEAGEGAKSIARDLNARRIPSPGAAWKSKVRRATGWTGTTITGSHGKGGGLLRNPMYRGQASWNKSRGKKRPGTGRRVQLRRPEQEWVVHQDEALRIVSDATWQRAQERLDAQRHEVKVKGGRPARYLLSGVLKCSCCGGSYVMANERNYRCSSQTNGRESTCTQRRVVNRKRAEERLIEGVKAKLLAPTTLQEIERRVQARVRDRKRPDRSQRADLASVERELTNAVNAVSKLGGSAAMLARVRELEARKGTLMRELAAAAYVPAIVPNVEQMIRRRVRELEAIPRDPFADYELCQKARDAVRGLLGGDVQVTEDADGVFAQVDLTRWYIGVGAQERT